jgi:hypothetical protein
MSATTKDCSTPAVIPTASCHTAPTLLTERELARAARLSPALLQRLRREGGGPAFVRVGSAIRYPAAAVAEWVDSLQAAT